MNELKRILYVEDQPDIRAVSKVALEKVGGFELQICSGGEEAVATAVAFEPELFLLDVMMPGMDGLETLKALRQLPGLDEVPVIFMTAKVQTNEVAEYKLLGAIEVIYKPFDPMAISDQIRAAWQQYIVAVK
ncbi:MAG: response regulator [Gammaproteobacteria bacterium]|nr:response regulator [Gammaproteobacteria bacterium]